MWPVRGPDKPADPIVPNVEVNVNTQYSIPYLSIQDSFVTPFTFTFIKTNAVNTQVAQRQQVRGSIMQFIRHRETRLLRNNSKNRKLVCCKIDLNSSDTLSLSVVSQVGQWTFRHCILIALNISATENVAHPASRCSSELWFWFLLLPAAQQGWSVRHCTLDTSTFGRQPIGNRRRREACCHFLATDNWQRLV